MSLNPDEARETGSRRSSDSAAHSLLGLKFADRWRVIEKIQRPPDATGANFSVGYIDFARVLQAMTEAFNFERDILGEMYKLGSFLVGWPFVACPLPP